MKPSPHIIATRKKKKRADPRLIGTAMHFAAFEKQKGSNAGMDSGKIDEKR